MTKQVPTFTEIEEEQQAKKDSIEPYVGYLIKELEEPTAQELIYNLFYIEAIYHRDTGSRLTDVTWERKHEESNHSHPLGAVITAPLLENLLGEIFKTNSHHRQESIGDKDKVILGVPDTFETDLPSDVDSGLIKELVDEIEDKTDHEMLEWCETYPLAHSDADVGEELYFTTMVGDPDAGTPDVYDR
mgnify:CR=1 FL=1